jgi:hypothetical protein
MVFRRLLANSQMFRDFAVRLPVHQKSDYLALAFRQTLFQ